MGGDSRHTAPRRGRGPYAKARVRARSGRRTKGSLLRKVRESTAKGWGTLTFAKGKAIRTSAQRPLLRETLDATEASVVGFP